MTDLLAGLLLLIGSLFALLAGIGLVRMPDLLLRMNAATKAGPVGVGLILIGAAIHLGGIAFVTCTLAVLAFIVLTTPIAAQVIGRAAYLRGVTLWPGTIVDELEGRYQPETHELRSYLPPKEV